MRIKLIVLRINYCSDSAILQDHSHSKKLLSELFDAAEIIAYRINHKVCERNSFLNCVFLAHTFVLKIIYFFSIP